MKNMTFRKSLTAAAVAASLGFPTLAIAQDTKDDVNAEEEVERIQVTGSRIKRTDIETATPVTMFDAKDIEVSGVNTVAEFLRENASTGGFNESATLNQSAGASAVGIKGFGDEYTLVLLNGRRLPKNSAGGIFVDINQIPMAAVERIEVVGDGASAIYGSDAVAGVINIITKKDYEGVDLTVTHGFGLEHHDGDETGFSLVAGAGNDKTNVLFALDYFSRDPIKASDRDLGKTGVLRDENGDVIPGGEGRSPWGIPVKTWIFGSPTAASSTWVPSIECPPENIRGGDCLYDFADNYQLQPKSDRQSMMTIVNHEFSDDFRGSVQARYTRANTITENAPAPGAIIIENDSPYIEDYLFNNRFADDPDAAQQVWEDVQNDLTTIYVGRRYLDFPNRTKDNTNETFEAIGSLSYDINQNYSLEGDLGFSRLTNRQIGSAGQLLSEQTAEAFSGELLNPFELNDCSADAETTQLCEDLQAATHRTGEYEIGFANVIFSGYTGIELGGGNLAFATGIDVRNERYKDVSDPATVDGQVIGGAASNGGGTFSNEAAFLEVSLPFFTDFNLDLAIRRDWADWELASDSETTYSLKTSYRPAENILLRASYGTGFKAPNLSNLFLAESSGVLSGTIDTKLCNEQIENGGSSTTGDCAAREINSRSGGNPELTSETSKGYNLGIVMEPFEGFSFSADYWSLEIEDIIGSLGIQEILDEEAEGRLTQLVVRNDRGRLDDSARNGFVRTNLQNLNESSAKGILWDVNYTTDLGFGQLSSNLRLEQYLEFMSQSSAAQPLCDSLDQDASRSWNANVDITLITGDVSTTVTARHLPGYNNWRSRNTQEFSCERVGWTNSDRNDDGELVNGGNPLEVASYTEIGVTSTYNFASNQSVTLGVRNLFDKQPPRALWDNWPFYSQGTFSNIGRFVHASYNISF